MIYQDHLNDGRGEIWSETYIHFYHHHQAFSNIEQGIVDDIFRPTSISLTITPTIYYLGVTVAGMVHISNFPITTSSIYFILRGKL